MLNILDESPVLHITLALVYYLERMISILQVVGRFVVGFGVSLSAIAECIYISEIAPMVSADK